uniref:NADH-ubiquinone oxidoreductase chain 2 n=1 Tax=Exothotettix guangxiensis TaxID=3068914 RepID=A0AA51U8P4_9ORTH|nr:NADH dehydrogenase subunit 2 [Exothotettix guangxiensis]WMV02055.1 NADH dehydrogenase subunit 2 [Exothotettix guangxiensis]
MKKTPMKTLFYMMLIMSTMMSITATSWLGVWMGLEINLLSFIPLISNQSMFNNSSIKYFITQTLASIMLITSFITLMMSLFNQHKEIIYMMMAMSILMKMGAAPMHFWFPEVMEFLKWKNCMLLMTWQKIAPMIMMSYINVNQLFMTIIIIMSATVGAILGLNQISLRLILSYSSINHMGWMLASIQTSMTNWMLYFMIYSLLTMLISFSFKSNNINFINEMFINKNNHKIDKLNSAIAFLSLGGMPPFIGFLPKWMLMQELMQTSMYFTSVTLIVSSTITLYFYMKMFLSAGILSFKENKWLKNNFFIKNKLLMLMNMISTLGLMLSPMILK